MCSPYHRVSRSTLRCSTVASHCRQSCAAGITGDRRGIHRILTFSNVSPHVTTCNELQPTPPPKRRVDLQPRPQPCLDGDPKRRQVASAQLHMIHLLTWAAPTSMNCSSNSCRAAPGGT